MAKKTATLLIKPNDLASGSPGEFNVHLIGANGEEMMHGMQGFRDTTDAKRGAKDIQEAIATAKIKVAP